MRHVITAAGLAVMTLSAGPASAGEQTITLAVDNMSCASCPYIVKRTLADVPGVRDVKVSFRKRTALVTFDDAKADVVALTQATGSMGFPSRLVQQGG